jgi:hypothetical protein
MKCNDEMSRTIENAKSNSVDRKEFVVSNFTARTIAEIQEDLNRSIVPLAGKAQATKIVAEFTALSAAISQEATDKISATVKSSTEETVNRTLAKFRAPDELIRIGISQALPFVFGENHEMIAKKTKGGLLGGFSEKDASVFLGGNERYLESRRTAGQPVPPYSVHGRRYFYPIFGLLEYLHYGETRKPTKFSRIKEAIRAVKLIVELGAKVIDRLEKQRAAALSDHAEQQDSRKNEKRP